jgi:hypothetical protein
MESPGVCALTPPPTGLLELEPSGETARSVATIFGLPTDAAALLREVYNNAVAKQSGRRSYSIDQRKVYNKFAALHGLDWRLSATARDCPDQKRRCVILCRALALQLGVKLEVKGNKLKCWGRVKSVLLRNIIVAKSARDLASI